MSTFSFRALALIAVRVARLIRSLREKKDSSKLTRVLTIYATRCIGLPVRLLSNFSGAAVNSPINIKR